MSKQFSAHFRHATEIAYASLVFTPFFCLYLYGLPEGFERVSPEIVNGLLTGSSILFGFASLPMIGKKVDTSMAFFIAGDVFLLGLSGVSFFYFGLGHSNGVGLLLFVASSFNANLVTALYRITLLKFK